MTKIAVINLKREIVGYAETATEARKVLNPVPDVAGASFRFIERIKLAADDVKHPGLECFQPHYGTV